jgi:hypothetical protein
MLRNKLDSIAKALLERETLDAKAFKSLLVSPRGDDGASQTNLDIPPARTPHPANPEPEMT